MVQQNLLDSIVFFLACSSADLQLLIGMQCECRYAFSLETVVSHAVFCSLIQRHAIVSDRHFEIASSSCGWDVARGSSITLNGWARIRQPPCQVLIHSELSRIPCGWWYMGQNVMIWSAVCSSAPHSLDAVEAMPHLCIDDRKRPTPVRRRFSRTQSGLGSPIPGGRASTSSKNECRREVPSRHQMLHL